MLKLPQDACHELNYGAMAGHRLTRPRCGLNDGAINTAREPQLMAVIGPWMEGDIIDSTVRSCFANGVERVYIIDNDSPDDTCERAEAAGAIIAKRYATDFYDDSVRFRHMNELIKNITEKEKSKELWWIVLDADEFPCGPNGERLIDYLAVQPSNVETVGFNAIDLYPTPGEQYHNDRHPADVMSMAWRRDGMFCENRHWKHCCVKYSNGVFDKSFGRGAHDPWSNRDIFESDRTGILFHAPIRSRESTFARLKALCDKSDMLGGNKRSDLDDRHINNTGAIKRWRTLEAVYRGDWHLVSIPHCQPFGEEIIGVALYPWRKLLYGVLNEYPRWYKV